MPRGLVNQDEFLQLAESGSVAISIFPIRFANGIFAYGSYDLHNPQRPDVTATIKPDNYQRLQGILNKNKQARLAS